MLYSPKYFFGPHASAQHGRFWSTIAISAELFVGFGTIRPPKNSGNVQKKGPLRNRLPRLLVCAVLLERIE
jgi:hypothetical protein